METGRLAEDFPYGQQAIKDRKKRREVNQATANTNEASSNQAPAATDVDSLTTNNSVAKDPVLPVPKTESPTSAGARKKSRVPVINASQVEAAVVDNARPLPPVPLEASAEESNLNLGTTLPCSVITNENTELTKKKLDLEIELLKKQVETASATTEIERARAEIERSKAEIEKARVEVEKLKAEIELLRLSEEKNILLEKMFR
ncbi:hypothetical protein E2C01_019634 [Portunus trituberculatus]|uniref:Uncharacterized protein n=1 Tax=Portunus trituberculatus TaxID=210409 RepID=A0A5B7E101_PORTR|nr:hypothetical protein [Portunus trituberculatus]